MPTERFIAEVCFLPSNPNAPKFFGPSELFAGLALMILAWTLAPVCAPLTSSRGSWH